MARAKSCVSSTAINRDSVCSASRGPGSMYSPMIRPASRNVEITALDRSFYDLVSKNDAFRVVLLKPFIGSVRGCEHLELVGMADVVVGIDVYPDHFL